MAEKSSAALLVLWKAMKTQRSGLFFGDAPPKGHHNLRDPKHGSKAMQRETMFQNRNELLGGREELSCTFTCFGKQRKLKDLGWSSKMRHQRGTSPRFRAEMSCLVAKKSSAALLVLSPAMKSKIWTGLQRCATKGQPSSPQLNSAKHRSSTWHHESIFQNWVEIFIGHCDR
jgi:hypothetical protein